MTNYEKLKSMSLEEMVDYLASGVVCFRRSFCCPEYTSCQECTRAWLEQEVKDK